MLGAALVTLWERKYQIYATSSNNFPNNPAQNFFEFDLKEKNYDKLCRWVQPEIIIHCAALVSHEYCQLHPEEAKLVNGESVKKLLDAFPYSKLVFISTDAVFPINTHLAKEATKTAPLTVYGKTKELGEKYILNSPNKSCIIRTTIVGKNINAKKQSFVEHLVNSLKSNQPYALFKDVLFTPITIWDLSDELEWTFNNKFPKILHISGSSVTDKYAFGYNLAEKIGLNVSLIREGKLANQLIKRSNDQSLDCSFYQKLSRRKLPDLNKTIKSLMKYFA